MTRVMVTMDRRAVDELATRTSRETSKRAADVTVERVRRNITRAGRVRTGKMRSSVDAKRLPDDSWSVGSDLDYFGYQDRGTRGAVARPGKFLVFRGRSGALVFAKKVRGVKPGHFLRDALRSLSTRDFTGT